LFSKIDGLRFEVIKALTLIMVNISELAQEFKGFRKIQPIKNSFRANYYKN
jgi:hypothetical protein